MPNPDQAAIDRMNYLASQATQESSMFSALSKQGYGGADAPSGIDNPESIKLAIGKAVALIVCHYAVKYKESTKEIAISKMLLPVQALYFSVGGETDPNIIRGIVYSFIKKAGKWDELTKSGGFGDNSIFGRKVVQLKTGVTGGGNDEQRNIFAETVLALFVARWASGENNALNALYVYGRVFNYLNTYFRSFGDDADPNNPILNVDEPTFRWLQNDSHTNLFLEIENSSDKKSPHNYTMFGYEDLNDAFKEPVDPQLMKDAEIQAYKLRGELHYDEWWWYNVPYCEDKHVPVKNPQGKVTGYNNIGPINFPCIDESKNIVPITGTLFERTFIEAPPVSGTYNQTTVNFITAKTQEDYPSNAYFGDYTESVETYLSVGDNKYITMSSAPYTATKAGSYISDISSYEPYYFINNHEGNAGKPWPAWG